MQTPEKKESSTREATGESEIQIGEPTKNARFETRNCPILRIVVNRELAADCVRASLCICFAAIVVILGTGRYVTANKALTRHVIVIVNRGPATGAIRTRS